MVGPREIPGLWWLPDQPTEKWIGVLKLAPNTEPELEFTVPSDGSRRISNFPPVLNGCDAHGAPITLLYPCYNYFTYSSVLTKGSYSAGFAVLGMELRGVDAFQVDAVRLNMQYLFDWLGQSGFQEDSAIRQEHVIRYILPDLLTYPMDQDRRVDVGLSLSKDRPFTDEGGREQRFRENASLYFHSGKGFTFKEIRELVTAIGNLLHFAVLKPVYPIRIGCVRGTHRRIEVCSSWNREPIEPELRPDEWVFKFTDVQTDFGKFVDRWLEFLKKFDEAMRSYLSTAYHSLTSEIAHICLTQALEAYHGVKNQSLHSRNVGFEKRVGELINDHRASMAGLFEDPKLPSIILANRNYYTHHNPEWLAKGVVSGSELDRLNEKLTLLFQVCILTEMGIPKDRFGRLRRQMAAHIIEYA